METINQIYWAAFTLRWFTIRATCRMRKVSQQRTFNAPIIKKLRHQMSKILFINVTSGKMQLIRIFYSNLSKTLKGKKSSWVDKCPQGPVKCSVRAQNKPYELLPCLRREESELDLSGLPRVMSWNMPKRRIRRRRKRWMNRERCQFLVIYYSVWTM